MDNQALGSLLGQQLGGAMASAQGLANYAQQLQGAKPRELGIIERVNGITAGLAELHNRIECFIGRLNPQPANATESDKPPCALRDSISHAEQHLRQCHNLIQQLNEAF